MLDAERLQLRKVHHAFIDAFADAPAGGKAVAKQVFRAWRRLTIGIGEAGEHVVAQHVLNEGGVTVHIVHQGGGAHCRPLLMRKGMTTDFVTGGGDFRQVAVSEVLQTIFGLAAETTRHVVSRLDVATREDVTGRESTRTLENRRR